MVLHRACTQVGMSGINSATVTAKLKKSGLVPRNSAALEKYIKKNFQAQVLSQLLESMAYNHEYVIRCKMEYWNLPNVPEGVLARRACRYLQHAIKLVPLKVVLVLFRTWFNGWCTARRFQEKTAKCLLGCGVQSTFAALTAYNITHTVRWSPTLPCNTCSYLAIV